jgi:hypothetical protein
MQKSMEERSGLKIEIFPSKEISTSSNARVKEILTKLTDKSVLARIVSYDEKHSETHSKYEKSGGW